MTLEEATADVTAKNQSVSNRMFTIRESIKRYRAEQGLEPLTLEEITLEEEEVSVLWTT